MSPPASCWATTPTFEHASGESADAHLEAIEVGDLLDLLAEPAAHLGTGVAGRNGIDVVLLVEAIHQVDAAAGEHPSVDHALVEPERQRRAEREGRVLADIVVRGRVAHLDRAVGHRV